MFDFEEIAALFDLEDRVKAWISVAHRTPLVTFAAALKLKFHGK